MKYNIQSLATIFNKFWEQLKSKDTPMLCECGIKYHLDQDKYKNRRIRCKGCNNSYTLETFIVKFIIENRKLDKLFNSICPNYQTLFNKILFVVDSSSDSTSGEEKYDPKKVKIEKNDDLFKIPYPVKRKSKISDKKINDEYITISDDEESSIPTSSKNIKPTKVRSAFSRLKYNHEFPSDDNLDKDDYAKVYIYGVQFESTHKFKKFMDKHTKCFQMIKTALLIGNRLVEVYVRRWEAKAFIFRVSNISEIDFVTGSIDRVLREFKNTAE